MGFHVWPFLDEESFPTIKVFGAQTETQEKMGMGSSAEESWPVSSPQSSPEEQWNGQAVS